jgi:predicted dithiol-disulfide oxidoreductase (DUF899 family)
MLVQKVFSESKRVESSKALLKKKKLSSTLFNRLIQRGRDLHWEGVNNKYVFEVPNWNKRGEPVSFSEN